MQFDGRGILLDIEGTTSSVSFVYDQMFPFVRRELVNFLTANWEQAEVAEACDRIAKDTGAESLEDWCGESSTADDRRQKVQDEVVRLMDNDVKATGLKALQGLIWKSGFESRELIAHLYDDVVPAMRSWFKLGIDLRIYSSGSIGAQKLFFGHTEYRDLTPLFSEHYDTTIGSKKESGSYVRIVESFGLPAEQILFVSDVPAELDAAHAAGMQTALSIRPGNAEVDSDHGHPEIRSFAEIVVA